MQHSYCIEHMEHETDCSYCTRQKHALLKKYRILSIRASLLWCVLGGTAYLCYVFILPIVLITSQAVRIVAYYSHLHIPTLLSFHIDRCDLISMLCCLFTCYYANETVMHAAISRVS